jgi:AAHS family 3-hydroxyphenylpropionic acid transporter
MYCGLPLGGALASFVAARGGVHLDWRANFYIGGFGPVILAPLLDVLLPNSRRPAPAQAEPEPQASPSIAKVLFGEGRAPSTVLLWLGYFFTLLVVYLLLNWVPTLMAGKGLTRPQSSTVALTMNLGAAVGSLVLGLLMDGKRRRAAVGVTYVGMALSLAALAVLTGFSPLMAAGACAGFFVIGGQLVLYALSPDCYPAPIRGAGVGAAVAAGRLGSIAGPLLGGEVLAAGYGAPVVLGLAVPGLAVAAIAVLALLYRPAAART